jgi:uncharacterized membrane protein
MQREKMIRVMFAFLLLSSVFCLLSFITVAQEAKAMSYTFTYTSSDTEEVGFLRDTTTFQSTLTNTGDQADGYVITMTKNPPTPPQWVVFFCSGGICHPPATTVDTVYLPVGEQDLILLEIGPRVKCGDANVTMMVTSIGNPGLSKSITFLLHARTEPECPVTNQWGLFILISLLLVTGFYLIWRRLRLARAT